VPFAASTRLAVVVFNHSLAPGQWQCLQRFLQQKMLRIYVYIYIICMNACVWMHMYK
jgi:hypothetical protein